jgi:ligand-binding sensor domain-containing protein
MNIPDAAAVRRLGVAVLAGMWVVMAGAAGTNSPWVARVWQTEEGLPDNNVTGLAQTPEGYLWVGTQNGLARFDGTRFQEVPLPLPAGRTQPMIRGLLLGRVDQMWLALDNGLIISLSPQGTNLFTATNGLSTFRPLVMAQAAGRAVWIGYVDGSVCRIAEGGRVTRFTGRDGLPGSGGCWLASDREGQLWFAKAGRVGMWRDDHFITLLTLEDKTVRIAQRREGGIWICAGLQLMKYDGGGDPVKLAALSPDRSGVEPSVLLEDRAGALWIGTTVGGLYHFDGTNVVKAETSHGDIRCLAEDREGNLWVGTGGGGLDRLRSRVLELQSTESGLPSETVRSVCEDSSGGLWAATQNGGLVRCQDGRWKSLATDGGWPGAQATCVASDKQGGVWIGTFRGGLYHWRDGKFTVLGRRDGLAGQTVRSLLTDSAGNLWIGLETSNCLQRLREGKLQTFVQPAGSRTIRAMAEDAAHNVWMGTMDGYLLRVEGDKLADETPHTLSPPKPIRCLHATPDGSLWIGYAGAGLGRLNKGAFVRVGPEQGLRDANISSIATDGQGRFWFASDHGVFQVQGRELEAVAAGRESRLLSFAYGRDEGLPSLQGNYGYAPGAAQSHDGRLWFPMRTGLGVVYPERVQANRIPPQVIIERVAADGRPVGLPGGAATLFEDNALRRAGGGPAEAALELPLGYRKLELGFTAVNFIAPESTRFRYRLDGWEEDWVDAGTQRSASYSRLPPGQYQFRVAACNNAGVWSEPGQALALVVQPFFWQTLWFRVGLLVVAAVCLLAWMRHVRRLHERIRYLELAAGVRK